jgi:hypothetical protein
MDTGIKVIDRAALLKRTTDFDSEFRSEHFALCRVGNHRSSNKKTDLTK